MKRKRKTVTKSLYPALKTLVFLLLFFMLKPSFAYKIECNIKDLPAQKLRMGRYSGPDFFLVDSAFTDNSGYAVFEKDKRLAHGIYFIVLPSSATIDFIVDEDQRFSLSTYQFHILDSLKQKGSFQNEAYIDFQRKMAALNKKGRQLEVEKKFYSRTNKDSLNAVNKRLKKLSDRRLYLYDSISKAFDGVLLGDIAKTLIPVKAPPNIKALQNRDPEKYFKWVKDNFFNNVNFREAGVFNTPEYIMHRKFKQFCRYFIDSNTESPDEIKTDIKNLINKASASETAHRYVVSFLISYYSEPQIYETEFILVYLADNYFSEDKIPWASDAMIERINHLADQKRNNLIGKTAKSFNLPDPDNDYYSPDSIKAEYKIIWFWDPGCPVCTEKTLELKQIYSELQNNNIEVLGVYYGHRRKGWIRFIEDKNLPWANVWNPHGDSGITKNYGLYKNPRLYILDKSNKIIAKDIEPQKIVKYIDYKKSGNPALEQEFLFNPPVFNNK